VVGLHNAVDKTEFCEGNLAPHVPATAMLAVVVHVHQMKQMGFQ
jgi:hypothetical protein